MINSHMKSCLRHLGFSLIYVIIVFIFLHDIDFIGHFAKLATKLWDFGLYVHLCYWKILHNKEVWFDLGPLEGSRWAIYSTEIENKKQTRFSRKSLSVHFTS